ncbi:hypothetical protein KY334_03700 [Candidatus Woesearchaeota archaeon]|nr:hypothetical protein [Candidatus Woesearchaeota archaeon]
MALELELKATRLQGNKLEMLKVLIQKFPASNFLTSPKTPCFIYERNLDEFGNQKLVAANLGSYEGSYFTILSENLRNPSFQDNVLQYMAKEEAYNKLIFQLPKLYQIVIDEGEMIKTSKFSKFIIKDGTFEDLLNDFKRNGYGFHSDFSLYQKTKEIAEKYIKNI